MENPEIPAPVFGKKMISSHGPNEMRQIELSKGVKRPIIGLEEDQGTETNGKIWSPYEILEF